jgi:hypothetical protein
MGVCDAVRRVLAEQLTRQSVLLDQVSFSDNK